MGLLAAGVVPFFIFTLWLYTAYMSRSFPSLTAKRILLLIAHPDDEAMFFAPTVQALSRPEYGNQFKIMCLSAGNADGLGETRKKELRASAAILGIDPNKDVLIVDDPKLPDGPEAWDPQHISKTLTALVAPDLSRTPNAKPPTANVDVIITFDKRGVSSHPNHISCHDGAVAFLAELMKGRSGWESPVTVYTLSSVNIVRKYIHVVDALPTVIATLFRLARHGGGRPKPKPRAATGVTPCPNYLFYVNGLSDWTTAQKAMVRGHWSQMVWFRWGWIGLGRYLVLNDLKKVKLG